MVTPVPPHVSEATACDSMGSVNIILKPVLKSSLLGFSIALTGIIRQARRILTLVRTTAAMTREVACRSRHQRIIGSRAARHRFLSRESHRNYRLTVGRCAVHMTIDTIYPVGGRCCPHYHRLSGGFRI